MIIIRLHVRSQLLSSLALSCVAGSDCLDVLTNKRMLKRHVHFVCRNACVS